MCLGASQALLPLLCMRAKSCKQDLVRSCFRHVSGAKCFVLSVNVIFIRLDKDTRRPTRTALKQSQLHVTDLTPLLNSKERAGYQSSGTQQWVVIHGKYTATMGIWVCRMQCIFLWRVPINCSNAGPSFVQVHTCMTRLHSSYWAIMPLLQCSFSMLMSSSFSSLFICCGLVIMCFFPPCQTVL